MRRAGCLWSIVLVAACGSNAPVADGGGAAGAEGGAAGAEGGAAGGSGGAALRAPSLHRAVATPCPTDRASPTCQHNPSPVNGGNCGQDSDCASGQNGRCVPSAAFDGNCDVCSYDECFGDADCSAAGPCDCRSSAVAAANVCSAGNCRVDADCGPGGYCSPSRLRCPDPGVDPAAAGWFCRTSKDTCVEDADCKSPSAEQECRYDGAAGLWRCMDYPGCDV